MESVRNVIVAIGFNRLFQEIVASALSIRGWRVLDFQQGHAPPDDAVEIALVACSADAGAVIEKVRCARGRFPAAKIVLLGVESPDADLIQFIEEGASAYVQGGEGMARLINTLDMVRNNRTPCSGRITQLVLGTIGRLNREHNSAGEAPLTLREKEILDLIRNGFSNKEIANELSIAPTTVKNHVHHLLEKLKVHSRHQAACIQICPPRRLPPAGAARSVTEVKQRRHL